MKEYTDAECQQLFQDLFPNGFASDDLMHTLAPNGWENTPYVMPALSIEDAYQGAKARKSLDKLMASIQTGNTSFIIYFSSFS